MAPYLSVCGGCSVDHSQNVPTINKFKIKTICCQHLNISLNIEFILDIFCYTNLTVSGQCYICLKTNSLQLTLAFCHVENMKELSMFLRTNMHMKIDSMIKITYNNE